MYEMSYDDDHDDDTLERLSYIIVIMKTKKNWTRGIRKITGGNNDE